VLVARFLFGGDSIIAEKCNAGPVGLCTCTLVSEMYNKR
jgi:hypothetical protein